MFLDYTKYLSQNYSWFPFVVDRHSNIQKQMSATLLRLVNETRVSIASILIQYLVFPYLLLKNHPQLTGMFPCQAKLMASNMRTTWVTQAKKNPQKQHPQEKRTPVNSHEQIRSTRLSGACLRLGGRDIRISCRSQIGNGWIYPVYGDPASWKAYITSPTMGWERLKPHDGVPSGELT